MRKQMAFPSLIILICIILFSLTRCSKGLNENASDLNQTSTGIKPDLLPGKCPYPCTDTRCEGYENGYCGTDTVAVVTNTANPEDSAGKRHNIGLSTIMPNYTSGIEPTQSNSWSYSISYLSSCNYSTSFLEAVQDTTIDRYGNALDTMTTNSFSSYAYSHGQMSTKLYTYLNSLGNLIGTLPAVPISTTYSSFASSVVSLESTILSDNTITSTDKIAILSATSVARYSGSYWINYYNAPYVAPGGGGGSWFSWSKVVGGDVVGAAAGAIGGAAGGVVFGGIGAGPGAAGGAVAVGIGSSVYEGGMQVWAHFFK